MVQPAGTGIPDVHTGAFANGLQAFEYHDTVCGIILCLILYIAHLIFLVFSVFKSYKDTVFYRKNTHFSTGKIPRSSPVTHFQK